MECISRKIFASLEGDKALQKAMSIFICLRRCVAERGGVIHDFTPNKIRKRTGISPETLKKYLPLLFELGFVSYGGHGKHLILHKVHSRHKNRNISIDKIEQGKFHHVYKQLRQFLHLIREEKKSRIKRILQTLHNPASKKEHRRARRQVRNLVKLGYLSDRHQEYKEYGFSLELIAKIEGVCIRTAQRDNNELIKRGWLTKQRHIEAYYSPNVGYQYVENATYTTKHYIVIVKANTYELTDKIRPSLEWEYLVGKK